MSFLHALILSSSLALVAQEPGAAPAVEDATVPDAFLLHLRDGSARWGTIAAHDPDGILFVLLGSGGEAQVPWSMIDPRQEQELRGRFGYVDVSSDELIIEAERLQLVDGDEIIGVILSREGGEFLVKTQGRLQPVPKIRVAGVAGGQRVPALDVYSRDEIYGRYLVEAAPDDAQSQYELAQVCERILDFAHAAEHYRAALGIDPEFRSEEVQFALDRAVVKAEQQEQIDYLREVGMLRKKGKFDQALEQAEAFSQAFPGSPLQADSRRARDLVLRRRDDAIRELVPRRWHYWLGRLARDAAKQLSHADAVSYASSRLTQDIQERVLADVQRQISPAVDLEQVLTAWAARDKRGWELASFGLGTWLLGEEAALKGKPSDTEERTALETDLDQERADLAKKIERFLKNQAQTQRARSSQDREADAEVFWGGFPVNARTQWIRAYYAENAGDMEVYERPHLSNCPSCAGKGVREVVQVSATSKGQGGMSIVRCPTCQGIGAIRRVRYR